MLKDAFSDYIHSAFGTNGGLEQISNLLKVHQLSTNRFSNLFMLEEFNSMERFYEKVHEYLHLCFIDNLASTVRKLKSILIFGRLTHENTSNSDFVIIYFEYRIKENLLPPSSTDGDQPSIDELISNHREGVQGQQNLYVFGDTYLHLLQVRNIVKNFFLDRKAGLQRVAFNFYEMKKAKTNTNLFHLHKVLVHCLVSILLNEGLVIQDIVSICRFSPATQFNYLSYVLEKIKAVSSPDNVSPTKLLRLTSEPIKLAISEVSLVDEMYNTLSVLGLDKPVALSWLANIDTPSALKRVVVPMNTEGKK